MMGLKDKIISCYKDIQVFKRKYEHTVEKNEGCETAKQTNSDIENKKFK